MFCEKCGKPLKKGQNFCPDCGTPAEENAGVLKQAAQTVSGQTSPPQTSPAPAAPESVGQTSDLKAAGTNAAASLKTLFSSLGAAAIASGPVQKLKTLSGKQKGILGGAAAVLVLALVCFAAFGGRGYKKTVDIFIKYGIEDPDAETIFSLVPEKFFEEAGYDEEDMEDLMETLEDACSKQQQQLRGVLGRNWTLTYTITDDEPQDEDALEEIQDDYEDICDIKVKDARVIRIKLRFKGSENVSANLRLPLVKIGNSWYIDYVSMDGILVAPSF